jgi:hypothetical protein
VIQFSTTYGEAPAGAPVPSDANELIMHTSMNHSCGPGTLTIQPTPNLSVHMPNRGDLLDSATGFEFVEDPFDFIGGFWLDGDLIHRG